MWWRSPRKEFDRARNAGNKAAFKRVVRSGRVPGLIAYRGSRPVGWCAVAPREATPGLDRSRVLKRLDEQPVWSITCFFIAREERGSGLAKRLVKEAVAYARSRGATLIEAYPKPTRSGDLPPVSVFMGTPDLFTAAGFREAARPSPARLVMRRALRPARRAR
jgi:GNAT superfamily N-acetyltransferase